MAAYDDDTVVTAGATASAARFDCVCAGAVEGGPFSGFDVICAAARLDPLPIARAPAQTRPLGVSRRGFGRHQLPVRIARGDIAFKSPDIGHFADMLRIAINDFAGL